MGIQDYTYRLKAQSGDTAPHDELGISGVLTGGTISSSPVDAGGGVMAWQVSGGQASVAIPAHVVGNATAGSGFTFAVRMRVSNYGNVDFTKLIGFGPDPISSATASNGVHIGRTSSGSLRASVTNQANTGTTSASTSAIVTLVARLRIDYSGNNDILDLWVGTTGRVSDLPDTSSSPFTLSAGITFDTFVVNAANSAVLQVAEVVHWPEQLNDATCADLADDLDGTIDVPVDGTALGVTLTATSLLSAGSAAGADAGTALGITLTAASLLIPGTAIVVDFGTITSDPFRNWTEVGLLAGEIIPNVLVIGFDRSVPVSLANQETNEEGRLVITDESIVTGEDYMLATFDEDGTNRGLKRYTAT
jgi:hypothetical protein